jgi:hypothetical protein
MASGAGRPGVPAASLGSHLDKLLFTRWLPPEWLQRVWNPADLPTRLEQRVNSLPAEAVWRAYTDGARLWCAIGAAADPPAHQPSAIALTVQFFGDDGELSSCGVWACVPGGEWRLIAPINTCAESGSPDAEPEARIIPLPSFPRSRGR